MSDGFLLGLPQSYNGFRTYQIIFMYSKNQGTLALDNFSPFYYYCGFFQERGYMFFKVPYIPYQYRGNTENLNNPKMSQL